jgi:hypothetical protein
VTTVASNIPAGSGLRTYFANVSADGYLYTEVGSFTLPGNVSATSCRASYLSRKPHCDSLSYTYICEAYRYTPSKKPASPPPPPGETCKRQEILTDPFFEACQEGYAEYPAGQMPFTDAVPGLGLTNNQTWPGCPAWRFDAGNLTYSSAQYRSDVYMWLRGPVEYVNMNNSTAIIFPNATVVTQFQLGAMTPQVAGQKFFHKHLSSLELPLLSSQVFNRPSPRSQERPISLPLQS